MPTPGRKAALTLIANAAEPAEPANSAEPRAENVELAAETDDEPAASRRRYAVEQSGATAGVGGEMSPEEQARKIVSDWLYSSRSGSSKGKELLIKSIAEALSVAVAYEQHEATKELTVYEGITTYLLEALEYSIKQCVASGHISSEPHMVKAREVIAKARGEANNALSN